jgi:hypothetical protein
MIAQRPLSTVARLTVAALLVGAAGSVLQVASEVAFRNDIVKGAGGS